MRLFAMLRGTFVSFGLLTSLAALATQQARADSIPLADAANYGVLYSGLGGNQLSTTNVTISGNVGVGGTGTVGFSGPGVR
jgi:hypothetical protein